MIDHKCIVIAILMIDHKCIVIAILMIDHKCIVIAINDRSQVYCYSH